LGGPSVGRDEALCLQRLYGMAEAMSFRKKSSVKYFMPTNGRG
jgi:hypothetical protein